MNHKDYLRKNYREVLLLLSGIAYFRGLHAGAPKRLTSGKNWLQTLGLSLQRYNLLAASWPAPDESQHRLVFWVHADPVVHSFDIRRYGIFELAAPQ